MNPVSLTEASKILAEGKLLILKQGPGVSVLCDGNNSKAIDKLLRTVPIDAQAEFAVWVDSDTKTNKQVNEVPDLAWDLFDASEGNLILVLPGGRNIDPRVLGRDGSIALRKVVDQNELKLCRSLKLPLLCTTHSENTFLSGEGKQIFGEDDYVLTLPPILTDSTPRSYSIVRLGLDNTVEIVRG